MTQVLGFCFVSMNKWIYSHPPTTFWSMILVKSPPPQQNPIQGIQTQEIVLLPALQQALLASTLVGMTPLDN